MTTAGTANTDREAHYAASEEDTALPLRGDTFLGVCEAIGTDLGFSPNLLRVPFAALILWDPKMVIGAYLGLGLVVALSRWLYPVQRRKVVAAKAAPAESAKVEEAAEVSESKELLAA